MNRIKFIVFICSIIWILGSISVNAEEYVSPEIGNVNSAAPLTKEIVSLFENKLSI